MSWQSGLLPQWSLHQQILFCREHCLPHSPLYGEPVVSITNVALFRRWGRVWEMSLQASCSGDCLPLLVLEVASATVPDIPRGNFSIYFVHLRGTYQEFCYWEIKINTLGGTVSERLRRPAFSLGSIGIPTTQAIRLPSLVFRNKPQSRKMLKHAEKSFFTCVHWKLKGKMCYDKLSCDDFLKVHWLVKTDPQV